MKPKIYSIPTCYYCNHLKELLSNDNIDFIDVNVMLDENQEEYKKIYEVTKSEDVPIIRIGKQLFVPDVSFKTIEEAADLVKKFINI
jgi:glutaredoxin